MAAAYIGNWEERGVIGSRIEITARKVTVLWRGAPVLETGYKAVKEGEKISLILKNNEMSYSPASAPYATVTALIYEDEKLYFEEHFPITGKSSATLTRTENNRYGDYSIEDRAILPQLAGTWTDENGWHTLTFRKNKLNMDGDVFGVHILKSRSGYPSSYKIAHEDPGKGDLYLEYLPGVIRQTIPICDAPCPMVIEYHKK